MNRDLLAAQGEEISNQMRSVLLGAVFSYPESSLFSAVAQTSRELAEAARGSEASRVFLEFAQAAENADLPSLEVEFNKIFVIEHPGLCSARFWLVKDAEFRREQLLADLAGIYRAWGLEVAGQAHELPDHLTVMFQFLGYLFFKEGYARQKGWEEQLEITRAAERFFWRSYLKHWLTDCLQQTMELVGENYSRTGIAAAVLCVRQLEDCLGGSDLEGKG